MDNIQSYSEHLKYIESAFELGKEYELLVLNSSMTPLFKPYVTHIRLVANPKIQYGSIVLYSRVSQSISIRRVVSVGNHTIDVRGILQRHVENKIPKSGVIGTVSAYIFNGVWIKTNSIVHILLCSSILFYAFFYRIYRNILKQIKY